MTDVAFARRDRQVVRILGILDMLWEGGQLSIHQLATKYSLKRGTIYRDLDALQSAGYPISDPLSHPRLLPEARRHAPHLRLTDSEIASLLWAAKQAKAGSPFAETLPQATAKLRAMAADEQAGLTAGIDAVADDAGLGAKDYQPHKETILCLVNAIIRRRRCALQYQSPASPAKKAYEYEPYRLFTVSGGFYCLGRVPPHESITTLAVDRIAAIKILESEFVVDPSLDIARYRQEAFGVMWEKPENITVRFTADQAPYVRERQWHPTQHIRDLPDGRLELTFLAGGTFEITRWVLGWGDAAEVIRPASLRKQIQSALARALIAYGNPPDRNS